MLVSMFFLVAHNGRMGALEMSIGRDPAAPLKVFLLHVGQVLIKGMIQE
jgi:hypothetical protein